MKFILIQAYILFLASIFVFPQGWQQTAATPEGSGVTDMVVRESNQHIFVTTGSFNWPNGDYGGVRRSTDDGSTWENLWDVFVARTIIDGGDGNLYASIWPYPSDEGLYRSTDNGDSWGSPLVAVPSGNNIFSIALNSTTPTQTIFAGTRNGPLRSTDNGATWAPAINGIPPNSWVRDIEVDSNGIVAAATTNGLFYSTNNGDLWEETTGIAASDTIVKLVFDYTITSEDDDIVTRLYGGSNNASLYQALRDSSNRYLLATLLTIFAPGEISSLAWIYLEAENYKMHGVTNFPKGSFGQGFYVSSDNGANWTQNNIGLPANPPLSALTGNAIQTRGSEIDVNFYTGFFENMNGGARIFKTTYTVTDVEPVSSLIPSDYELKQNYPNPFNPSTNIEYSIPEASFVQLKVYDILGNEVATLVNEEQSAGAYRADFKGEGLASGLYIAKLTAGNFVQTIKMSLLK